MLIKKKTISRQNERICAFSQKIKARNEVNGLRCKRIALDQRSILGYTFRVLWELHKIPMPEVQILFVRDEAST